MTAQELFNYLIGDAGLDEATAKAVMAAASNEKVAAKAGTLKQQQEFDAIQAKTAELQAKLDGTKDKPGASAYEQWYQKNWASIQQLQQTVARYQERYGALDEGGAAGAGAGAAGAAGAGAAAGAKPMTKEEIATVVNEVIQGNYGPRWSTLLTSTGTILERHIRAGRKNPIDWQKLSQIAETKGGDVAAAYEEWDKPEAEASAKAAQDKEVERRVKEELAKRQTQAAFPAGADATPSGSAGITRGGAPAKYDRTKVIEAAVTGKYDGNQAAA